MYLLTFHFIPTPRVIRCRLLTYRISLINYSITHSFAYLVITHISIQGYEWGNPFISTSYINSFPNPILVINHCISPLPYTSLIRNILSFPKISHGLISHITQIETKFNLFSYYVSTNMLILINLNSRRAPIFHTFQNFSLM